jgi:hypothetical protein
VPRFFFHVSDGRDYPDLQGTVLASLSDVRVEAVRFAADLLKDNARRFWEGEEWSMRVADDQDLTLFTLMFVAVDAAIIPPKRDQLK